MRAPCGAHRGGCQHPDRPLRSARGRPGAAAEAWGPQPGEPRAALPKRGASSRGGTRRGRGEEPGAGAGAGERALGTGRGWLDEGGSGSDRAADRWEQLLETGDCTPREGEAARERGREPERGAGREWDGERYGERDRQRHRERGTEEQRDRQREEQTRSRGTDRATERGRPRAPSSAVALLRPGAPSAEGERCGHSRREEGPCAASGTRRRAEGRADHSRANWQREQSRDSGHPAPAATVRPNARPPGRQAEGPTGRQRRGSLLLAASGRAGAAPPGRPERIEQRGPRGPRGRRLKPPPSAAASIPADTEKAFTSS